MPDSKHQPPPSPASERGRKLWKPGRSSRMKAGLVGLSSAAIVSVYAAGYLNTRADESANLVAASASTASAVPSATATATVAAPTQAGSKATTTTQPQARATATPSPATTASGTYKDGTYVGVGTSRHGSIQATVVVEAGKIVSAEITGCNTKYPCSKVASLPGQVVAKQSSTVNVISGATDSSRAYMGAVSAALAQAKA